MFCQARLDLTPGISKIFTYFKWSFPSEVGVGLGISKVFNGFTQSFLGEVGLDYRSVKYLPASTNFMPAKTNLWFKGAKKIGL